ncbi:MAG: hypothetical protein IMF19_11835, partial [Proteobacteria bacterium]|nr:hypothetical protein [Pseudomonadota bacterium]
MIGTGVVIAIALIGFMVKTWWTLWNLTTNLAAWKGGLDQWKKGIDDWRNSVDKRFDKFEENTIMLRDGETITKTTLWDLGRTNDMIQRHSPLVPSKQAIEILEELNIIPEVNANTSYIQEEIEKRAQTSLYRDIED